MKQIKPDSDGCSLKWLCLLVHLSLLIAATEGCAPPSGPSNENTTIVSISEDSLFAGDHFIVTVDRELKGDSVKLFVGHFKLSIDSMVGLRIHATAATGFGAYQVRLYVNDQQATGDYVVHLLGRSIYQLAKLYVKYFPLQGKIGDTIRFTVDTSGINAAKLNPRLNGVPLVYLSGYGPYALYTLPASVQDGPMQIQIFNREATLPWFDVIRPETDLPFEEGTFYYADVLIGATGHMLRLNTDGTSELYSAFPFQGGFGVLGKPVALQFSDSIRLDFDSSNSTHSRYCYMRMHFDPQTRLISGKISGYRREPGLNHDTYFESIEMEFTGFTWHRNNGVYHVYVEENALSHISNLKYSSGIVDVEKSVLQTYEPPDFEEPYVFIRIRP